VPRPWLPIAIAAIALLLVGVPAQAAVDRPAPPGVPPTQPTTFSKDGVIVQWMPGAQRSAFRPALGRKLGALVVKSTAPTAGASPASGKVDLTLGPKPKPKKHRH
jgi:hypothetical protein